MRSLKEISVGNGWYWLAGAAIVYLAAWVAVWVYGNAVGPLLPVLAWHRTHPRKMQFAEFNLDIPPLWYVPKADYQQPNDISIDKARFPGHSIGTILLSKSKSGSCVGCFDRARTMWARMYGTSDTTPRTFSLESGQMGCLYHEVSPSVTMWCINEKTGSWLAFDGSKKDFLRLPEIVR